MGLCCLHQPSSSREGDVLAFGRAISDILRDYNALHVETPRILSRDEQELLRGMINPHPAERMDMATVVHTMERLVGDLPRSPALVGDIEAYVFPSTRQQIRAMLDEARSLCNQNAEFAAVNNSVYVRLEDLYQQLIAMNRPIARGFVEDFCLLLSSFNSRLDQQSGLDAAPPSAPQTIAGRHYNVHHSIDNLLWRLPFLDGTALIHRWRQPAERPVSWYISPADVELGDWIADGSFGSTYYARWLGTDVVVKLLTNYGAPIAQFQQELRLWFSLSHDNLIKLYGACDRGRPFFVCEPARQGILPAFLRGKIRSSKWDCLWYVGRGLGHLHDRGIVHGDLKGNNILVGEDETKAKLADFGLSLLQLARVQRSTLPVPRFGGKRPSV